MTRGSFVGALLAGAAAAARTAPSGAAMTVSPLSGVLARRHAVAKIDVAHLDDAISTRTAVTPAALRELAGEHHAITGRAALDAVLDGLAALAPKPAARPGDLRWGLVLRDAHGAALATVDLDRFGRRAHIDGADYDVSGEPLLACLRRR
jgi:hypothetical protein